MVGGWLAPPDWAHAVPITELISWRKLTQPMYESDEDRVDAAEQLAEHIPHAAAKLSQPSRATERSATRGGAAVRRRAARRRRPAGRRPGLPGHRPRQAVGDEVRLFAAERLADVVPVPLPRFAWPSRRPSGRRRGAAVRRRAARRRRPACRCPGLPGHRPRRDGRRRGAPFRRRAARGPRGRCDAGNRHASLTGFHGLGRRYRTMASIPDT